MSLHEISRTFDASLQSASCTRVTTLAALIDAIAADASLPARRRADMCSAVRSLCRSLGLQTESTPADPRLVAERLKGLTPAAARMNPARLQNCRALMDGAFAYADHHFGRRRNLKSLDPAYAELLKLVPERWDANRLRRLFHFAGEMGLHPHEVDAAIFDRFLEHLKRSTLPDPKTLDRETRKLWNRMCATVAAWPGHPVMVPSYVDHWALAAEAFPQSLWDDLDAYLHSRLAKAAVELDDLLTEEELFGEGVRADASPIRASTANLIRYRVRQFASALALSGSMPVGGMTSLAALVPPAMVNAGLKFFIQRASGEKQNSQIRGIASDLMMIAKLWARSPEVDLAKLRLMVKKTRPVHEGLPESARRSLAPFRDLANVRAFLAMPEAVVAEAQTEASPTRMTANRVAAALWMKIAQRAPLRINNLLNTDLSANVLRAHAGKGASVALFYPADEVKNGKTLEVPLPAATARMLDLYLKKYRPLLIDAACPWLFPAESGGSKRASVMSADLQKLMRDRIGFRINPHSFRHVAAKLYLTAHPGDYESVQRILGHKSRQTTVTYYCELEAEEAFRHFDAVLLKLEDAKA